MENDQQLWIKALDRACTILNHNLEKFSDKFPSSTTKDGFYHQVENKSWTPGFCTGMYWLAYEHTGDSGFRQTALRQVNSFLHRIEHNIDTDNHDMGFLYTPSCVAAYMLTGSPAAEKAALLAAEKLCSRFQEKGRFIQAWGVLNAPENYRMIIDCLLNVPLLYWAAGVTGRERYRNIADAHVHTSMKHLVRSDNSTFHTFFFDPQTGAPLYGCTRQGYRDDSAWARGQAWGIYGMALAYHYTHETGCIDLYQRVTDYYLAHLPADGIPYWDLCFKEDSGEPRDSSAAVIACCGMLEMAKYLPQQQAEQTYHMVVKIARCLVAEYAVPDAGISNGLLMHGVYAKSSPFNPIPKDDGVDECNLWGDYFYMELLTRLTTDWEMYW